MKAIMISIKPEWVCKILNGEKTIEIRKTMPKCELPCKIYIYCTNGYMLYDIRNEDYPEVERKCTLDYTRKSNKYLSGTPPMLNRKVVAYFTLNKIEKYIFGNKVRYVWYIEDLKVYDKPKELSEFRKDLDCDDYPCNKGGKNSDCEYCYYDYSEGCQACGIDLYSILDRVSCWCCANKNLKELKNYYLYLPKYWQKLKDLQSRTDRPFKNNKYTIFDLEEKFKLDLTHQHEDKGE